eukprot:scaffold355_cov127-Skeletonema_dohrnii-CCMP3373.AAC.7
MPPQLQQEEMHRYNTTHPSPIHMRSVLSRWADADLMLVLGHANGDFAVALETILRHEATGQPPRDLIRRLSGGGGIGPEQEHSFSGVGVSSRRMHSYSESSPHIELSNGAVALDNGVSMGAVTYPTEHCVHLSSTSLERLPYPQSSTFVRNERVPTQPNTLALRRPEGESWPTIAVPRRNTQGRGPTGEHTHDMSSFQDHAEQESGGSSTSTTSSRVNSAISRLLGLDSNKKLSQKEKDEILLQILSSRRHRKPDASASKPKTKKHQQGTSRREVDMLNIQAGIEASLKQTRNTTEANLEDEALSYAVKASRETFDEECRQIKLRNALERKVIKTLLVESLSDPVKKSEEELVTKAMSESLADPVKRSEEEIIEEVRALSLRDPIKRSEEELVEEAIQQSLLQKPTKDEELIEAMKRQSLSSLSETLSESVGKNLAQASMPNTSRRSFTEEDLSECITSIHGSPPSVVDFSSKDSAFLDCKMPAQILPGRQAFDNDVTESPSIVDVTLKAPASLDHIQDEENARAHVSQDANDPEILKSLSVEGASFSLVNGVYEEVKESAKTFTRRLDWDGVIATATIRQTSTQASREWVLYIANCEMDVILYTASVDSLNEDSPSPSTKWVGVSHMVQGGPPPKVTEL